MNTNKKLLIDARGLVVILFTLISLIFYIYPRTNSFVNYFTFIDVLFVMILLYRKEKRLSFFFVFMSALAVFHFGQVPLEIFGLPINESYGYDLYSMYPGETMQQTLMFCCTGFNLLMLPYFISTDNVCKNNYEYEISSTEKNRAYRYGVLLFWILLFPVLVYDFTLIRSSITLGYQAKYEYSNSFLTSVDMYFPMAVICIIAGGKRDNNWKKYYTFTLLRQMLQMIFVGNRGPIIICLIIYEITRRVFQNNTKVKNRWIYAIVALGIVLLLPFIAMTRDISNSTSIIDYIMNYNPVAMVLSEFGSTLITPILAFDYVQEVGKLCGKTFLGGLAIILPFSSRYLPNIREYMNVGAILNPYSPLGGALGGSMFADVIINFSYGGLLLLPIIGMIVKRISYKIEAARYSPNIVKNCLLIYFGYGLLLYTRGSAQDIGLALKRTLYMLLIYLVVEAVEKKGSSK